VLPPRQSSELCALRGEAFSELVAGTSLRARAPSAPFGGASSTEAFLKSFAASRQLKLRPEKKEAPGAGRRFVSSPLRLLRLRLRLRG